MKDIQVHTLNGPNVAGEAVPSIEQQLNGWLEQNKTIEVIDIKIVHAERNYVAAMIIYHPDRPAPRVDPDLLRGASLTE